MSTCGRKPAKGDPTEVLKNCKCREETQNQVHEDIKELAKVGFRSLAVAKMKMSQNVDGYWEFLGLLPCLTQ